MMTVELMRNSAPPGPIHILFVQDTVLFYTALDAQWMTERDGVCAWSGGGMQERGGKIGLFDGVNGFVCFLGK